MQKGAGRGVVGAGAEGQKAAYLGRGHAQLFLNFSRKLALIGPGREVGAVGKEVVRDGVEPLVAEVLGRVALRQPEQVVDELRQGEKRRAGVEAVAAGQLKLLHLAAE